MTSKFNTIQMSQNDDLTQIINESSVTAENEKSPSPKEIRNKNSCISVEIHDTVSSLSRKTNKRGTVTGGFNLTIDSTSEESIED